MPTVHFLGCVLPQVDLLTFGNIPSVLHKVGGTDLEFNISINIVNSQIDIKCEVNRFDREALPHLHKIAQDLARACVNMVAFSKGWALSVHILTIVDPDGKTGAIKVENSEITSVCTAFSIDQTELSDFSSLLGTVMTEHDLFITLDDLMTSVTVPHSSITNCGRTVEGIRHLISPGKDRDEGWQALRDNLNAEEGYIRLITKAATQWRHGDKAYTSDDLTREIRKRSWILMNRYFEFRKRGNQPLPPDEFPLLSS